MRAAAAGCSNLLTPMGVPMGVHFGCSYSTHSIKIIKKRMTVVKKKEGWREPAREKKFPLYLPFNVMANIGES